MFTGICTFYRYFMPERAEQAVTEDMFSFRLQFDVAAVLVLLKPNKIKGSSFRP